VNRLSILLDKSGRVFLSLSNHRTNSEDITENNQYYIENKPVDIILYMANVEHDQVKYKTLLFHASTT